VTRLAFILSALAVIVRSRVPVLPGWEVPALTLLAAMLLIAAAAAVTVTVAARSRTWTPAVTGPLPAPESEGTALS